MSEEIWTDVCPFCGNEDTKVILARPFWMLKKFHGKYAVAGCPECGASTILFKTCANTRSPLLNKDAERRAKQEAADAWNMRGGVKRAR